MRYYTNYNNGVTALISEEVSRDIKKQNTIWQLCAKRDAEKAYGDRMLGATASSALNHLCVPIFTFVDPERAAESPWFTGDNKLLNALLDHINENGGFILTEHNNFYVPFSNGSELGMHGEESMKRELAYVTTEMQFRGTFGVSIQEIKARICRNQ